MDNIHVGRYSNPEGTGWAGWIEPDDKRWILFVGLNGETEFFDKRDPMTGAVL